MKKHVLLLFLGLAPAWIYAQNASDSISFSKNKKVASVQYGIASYYHNKFEGRKTANGEIFSQQGLTAACNSLPLNCWIKVTNTKNKKTVILKINDRMHPNNSRLIDLSLAAAKKLNYTGRGLTSVRVEYLGRKKPEPQQDPIAGL